MRTCAVQRRVFPPHALGIARHGVGDVRWWATARRHFERVLGYAVERSLDPRGSSGSSGGTSYSDEEEEEEVRPNKAGIVSTNGEVVGELAERCVCGPHNPAALCSALTPLPCVPLSSVVLLALHVPQQGWYVALPPRESLVLEVARVAPLTRGAAVHDA